jgi:predicted nucleic acid-binding protein
LELGNGKRVPEEGIRELALLPAVSNAGPLIHLAQISKLHLLKKLFKNILIIPEVRREVVDEGIKLGHSDALTLKEVVEEGWIIVKSITRKGSSIAKRIAEGENVSKSDAETLMLAIENKVRNMLVDEKILSDLAKMHGFIVWNTWTILLEALRIGFIEIHDAESAIKDLGERRHKLKAKQAAEILEAAKLIASTRQRSF